MKSRMRFYNELVLNVNFSWKTIYNLCKPTSPLCIAEGQKSHQCILLWGRFAILNQFTYETVRKKNDATRDVVF